MIFHIYIHDFTLIIIRMADDNLDRYHELLLNGPEEQYWFMEILVFHQTKYMDSSIVH